LHNRTEEIFGGGITWHFPFTAKDERSAKNLATQRNPVRPIA